MAEVHRLPDQQRVLREASEWIARLEADDVTAADRERFEAWRGAHPMHGRAFDELAGTLDRFAAVRPLVRAVAFGQSINEIAGEIESRAPRVRTGWRRAAWAAAVLVLVGGCGWLVFLRQGAGHLYVTAIGEHATISLPDGSTIELDSDSAARVEFSRKDRVVRLERGEAFFRVVHHARRPFWVIGGGAWVRDVGTAFNVDLGSNGVRVTVSAGRVRIGASSRLLRDVPFAVGTLGESHALSELSAGEEADLHGNRLVVHQLDPAQVARAVSWRAGTLYFQDEPLSRVIDELSRYTPLEIEVTDPDLRKLAVGGTFQANPQGVQTFLTLLQQGLGLAIHRRGDRVIIQRSGTKAR